MRRSKRNPFALSAPVLLFAAVLLAGAPGARAALTDTPTAWSNFVIVPYTFDGIPARDYEGGLNDDKSNGGSSFSSESEIASGYPQTSGTCNPDPFNPDFCGSKTSAYWAYYDGGTTWDGVLGSASMNDDYYFMRMRINGSPLQGGASNLLNNNHWNFLIDQDGDGFKEFWIDVFGNNDIVRILYENNGSNSITNDNPIPPSTDTWINELTSCATTTGSTSSGSACTRSHTRAFPVNDATLGDPTDTTGEWFVDVQVPIRLLTDSSSATFGVPGTQVILPNTPLHFIFSTSDSSTNPLQKDFISRCNAAQVQTSTTCFGDATPVGLAYFRASRRGDAVRFEWATANEVGNLGFELLVEADGGWRRINPRLVPSKKLDSLAPLAYSYEAAGIAGEVFALRDVDVRGRQRLHGPFALGQAHGKEPVARSLDWQAVRAESRAKAASRLAERRRQVSGSQAANAANAANPAERVAVGPFAGLRAAAGPGRPLPGDLPGPGGGRPRPRGGAGEGPRADQPRVGGADPRRDRQGQDLRAGRLHRVLRPGGGHALHRHQRLPAGARLRSWRCASAPSAASRRAGPTPRPTRRPSRSTRTPPGASSRRPAIPGTRLTCSPTAGRPPSSFRLTIDSLQPGAGRARRHPVGHHRPRAGPRPPRQGGGERRRARRDDVRRGDRRPAHRGDPGRRPDRRREHPDPDPARRRSARPSTWSALDRYSVDLPALLARHGRPADLHRRRRQFRVAGLPARTWWSTASPATR